MTYRIEITARAQADADAAYAWMAENLSPAFAGRWYQELFRQIETLTRHPARCPIAAESGKFAEEIRELTYGKHGHKNKYRIIFAIRRDVVAVLFIDHGARKDLEP